MFPSSYWQVGAERSEAQHHPIACVVLRHQPAKPLRRKRREIRPEEINPNNPLTRSSRAYPVVSQNNTCRRADERSVIRRMSGPHTADNAALIRPTKTHTALSTLAIFGANRISTL